MSIQSIDNILKGESTLKYRHGNYTIILGLLAVIAGVLTLASGVHAQGASFPDVSQNHWAYQSVQDLADMSPRSVPHNLE